MGKNTTNDMTQGNCMRLLVQFFLPILAGNLFQQLYSFADSMVVGKGIGDTALAAVGNTGSVHFLIIGFAIGLTGGLGICISQSFGSGNYEKLRKELAMSVWICLAIGIVITVVSLAFMRQLFTFLHTPEDLMTETLQYFGTILAGNTITIFNNFAMTLLRSVGNSRAPLVAMIISAIANVLMDLLFVFPLHMGVFGAALATVLAQVLSALYCCYYIGREKNLIPKKTDWKPQSVIIKRLTLKGLPVAVMNSVTAVGGMVLQTFVNNMGTSYVAAYAACTKILSLFEQPANTVGLALLTFVGQNYGAGKMDRVHKGVRTCMEITAGATVLLSVILYNYASICYQLFTTDAQVVVIGEQILHFLVPTYFTYIAIEILSGTLRGIGDSWLPMIICCLGICALRVVWILTAVPLKNDILTIVFSYPLTWTVTSIAFIVYYLFFSRLKIVGRKR